MNNGRSGRVEEPISTQSTRKKSKKASEPMQDREKADLDKQLRYSSTVFLIPWDLYATEIRYPQYHRNSNLALI